ncbi:MAG TPA: sugar phosphate nucleotidyltransferase [Acidobacteriota bacterium]|nr:sugar phosphate nucleotidyltransferase [Acidobacteriota bacterium]
MIYGIIMAGGKGERFWPLSRLDRPKQFLKLTSDMTMLDETIGRIQMMIPLERLRIVTAESMAGMVLDSADCLKPEHIFAEPCGRNTSLAIGLAAVHIRRADPEAVMVVLSADHLIRPAEKLIKILEDGCRIAAKDDVLITVGIVPTRPETSYGYIKLGKPYPFEGGTTVYEVMAFTEKPKTVVAQEYYYSHKYLWNAGMFIWTAESILKALAEHRADVYAMLMEYADAIGTDGEADARTRLYEKSPSISVDYAVLEKAGNVLTMKADIVWDDVGSWNALERYKERDSDNNVVVGSAVLHDSFETTVFNDSEGVVTCLGVSDLVVVRSSNITLVAHKTKLLQIKELLNKLGEDEETRKYL